MHINWQYNANDFRINEKSLVPEGDHRVVINRVTYKTYSSGKEGFEIMLDVSGYPGKLWHHIIMDPSNPEKTNHRLGKFFESFNIANYDLNCYEDWVGKDGAVRVKHDCYNGANSAKVLFCITRAFQGKLPAWGEPPRVPTYAKSVCSQPFDNTSCVSNGYAQTVPTQRPPMEFNGYSF